MADITEIIRIDSRNNLHLSPEILSTLNVRGGDNVVVVMEEDKDFVILMKKEGSENDKNKIWGV